MFDPEFFCTGQELRNGLDHRPVDLVPARRRPGDKVPPVNLTEEQGGNRGPLYCGPNTTVQLVHPNGSKFPWTAFVQKNRFWMFVVERKTDGAIRVVTQFRVGDTKSIELPGGDADTLQDAMKLEFAPESGLTIDDVHLVTVYSPSGHDVARKLSSIDRGPLQHVVCHVVVNAEVGDTESEETEGRMTARWVTRYELNQMIQSGRLYCLPSRFALLQTRVLQMGALFSR